MRWIWIDKFVEFTPRTSATADPSFESAPPPVYAVGSTALKTISMSCSGKASLDTPIRLLAH